MRGSSFADNMNRLIFLLLSLMVLFTTFGCPLINGEDLERNTGNTGRFAFLIAEAEKKGSVKVIIRLRAPEIEELTKSSAQLKDPDAAAQADREIAAKIAAVADAVLTQIKDTRYRINHRYDSLPLLALDVSVEALRILALSPDVLSITEDKPIPLH